MSVTVVIVRLGRSAEFIVYGHGQQRRAVIEATRLATLEIQTLPDGAVEADSSEAKGSETGIDSDPAVWKEKAKQWQQFVTQVRTQIRYTGMP